MRSFFKISNVLNLYPFGTSISSSFLVNLHFGYSGVPFMNIKKGVLTIASISMNAFFFSSSNHLV